MKKKIWIINHYAGGMFSQLGGRHYWFAKYLKKQGYEPVIFCCNAKHGSLGCFFNTGALWQEHVTENGIPFVFVRSRTYEGNGKQRVLNMIDFYRNVQKTTKEYAKTHDTPDVIYASSVHPLTIVAGIQLAKHFGVECIGEVRDLWPESIVAYSSKFTKQNLLIRLLYQGEKWIYKKVDKLIFTMEGGRDYIIEKGWDRANGGLIDLAKVYHINNGVDLEGFKSNITNSTYTDGDLENPGLFKVVYTGSIRLVNQVHELINVAKILRDKGKDKIKILIWGAGDQVEEIKKIITDEGLTNIELKGCVPKSDVPAILAKSDLNVYLLADSPLYKFGLSLNKSFEYFTSGKPVLASANSGYSIIDRYQCGKCLNEFTPESMANEIIHFANIPKEEYDEYCQNARCAAQDYDFKVLTEKLLDVIENA